MAAVILCLRCAAAPAIPESTSPPPDGDLEPVLENAARDIRARARVEARRAAPGAPPAASASAAETYLALAGVQVERARDCMRMARQLKGEERDLVRRTSLVCMEMAKRLLAVRDPKGVPARIRRRGMLEHAYFARNDGSPQLYVLYVPASYATSRKPFPLVLFLHGWDPSLCRLNPWTMTDDVLALAEKHNLLFAVPHGRTNTDFQFAGEVDVLRVLAEVQRFYRVDADRVYLMGVSMGGAGVWQIGMHYPDRFAAAAPINAQGDWFRFWHEQFKYPVRDALPGHIRWILGMHNPVELARNFHHVYSYSQHATKCFLGPVHTKSVVKQLKTFGAPHAFFEDPSELGHQIYFETDCYRRALEHLVKRRRVADPDRVRYATWSLRHPGAYWATIDRLQRWGRPATIDGRLEAGGRIRLQTENVAALVLAPPAARAGDGGAFRVAWNDRELPARKPDAEGRMALVLPGSKPPAEAALAKTRAVCGPASDVFNFPFVAVRGTRGTEAETRALAALAARFAADWQAYAEGRVRVVRDTEVTDAMIRERGLVLFGLPETNAVVGRIAAKLPFRLSRKTIALPDGRAYPTGKVGLALTYPNPLAPERYVLIFNGVPWGAGRTRNHKFDYLPDFTVYTADTVPAIGTNRHLAAGLFDELWRYDPKLTDFGDATAPGRKADEAP
jgi:pimeloyl-ACP methyl ester carboxylesterase